MQRKTSGRNDFVVRFIRGKAPSRTLSGDGLEKEHWERKYYLALETLERDEKTFRALEECLRRLVSRLAILARGHGTQTDGLLDQLTDAMRQVAPVEAMDPLLVPLADAINRLDPEGRAAPRAPAADNESGLEALRQILLRVVLIPALAEQAVELRAALNQPQDAEALPTLAGQVADLVNRQRENLRADIAQLEELLREVSVRLDEMTRYLVHEIEDQSLCVAESRELDSSVRQEMQLLGQQTLEAGDLTMLQQQVSSRLEMIDQHFREYRDREDARLDAYRERAERMRSRVEELETQTTSLQDSLRREHARALTDQLTGMPNRLAFEQHIDEGYRYWLQTERMLCVATFDIDHFKRINDSFGHAAGDAVLRIVGQAMMEHATPDIFVSRYGGEEFAVAFGGMALDAAMALANELRGKVEALAFHSGARPVKITMSGGVARFQDGDTPASVFERADRALYAAKRAGRNRCAIT
jgi:diguanylate cyclase